MYITTGFSLNMLESGEQQTLRITPLTAAEAAIEMDQAEEILSAITNQKIADIINKEIGSDLEETKRDILLRRDIPIMVAQPVGSYHRPSINYWLIERKDESED